MSLGVLGSCTSIALPAVSPHASVRVPSVLLGGSFESFQRVLRVTEPFRGDLTDSLMISKSVFVWRCFLELLPFTAQFVRGVIRLMNM